MRGFPGAKVGGGRQRTGLAEGQPDATGCAVDEDFLSGLERRAVAQRLQALAWWDWEHGRLHEALGDFRALDVEAFLEKHGA